VATTAASPILAAARPMQRTRYSTPTAAQLTQQQQQTGDAAGPATAATTTSDVIALAASQSVLGRELQCMSSLRARATRTAANTGIVGNSAAPAASAVAAKASDARVRYMIQ
jgi:hypothetical protein